MTVLTSAQPLYTLHLREAGGNTIQAVQPTQTHDPGYERRDSFLSYLTLYKR